MQYSVRYYSQSAHPSDLNLWAKIKCRQCARATRCYNTTLNKFLIMLNKLLYDILKRRKKMLSVMNI